MQFSFKFKLGFAENRPLTFQVIILVCEVQPLNFASSLRLACRLYAAFATVSFGSVILSESESRLGLQC